MGRPPETGTDNISPRCPRCGRRTALVVGTRYAMQARHKDPKTKKWCRKEKARLAVKTALKAAGIWTGNHSRPAL
jgi:hypothetical protein